METIELSGRTGQEVYEELKHRLEGMGYLPDEYFMLDADWEDGRVIPRNADLFCTTDYGDSEGIYLDVYLKWYGEDGKSVIKSFATGKTLGESGSDMDRMFLISSAITKAFHGEQGAYARYRQMEDGTKAEGVVLHLSPKEQRVLMDALLEQRMRQEAQMTNTEQLLRRMTGSITAYMDEGGARPPAHEHGGPGGAGHPGWGALCLFLPGSSDHEAGRAGQPAGRSGRQARPSGQTDGQTDAWDKVTLPGGRLVGCLQTGGGHRGSPAGADDAGPDAGQGGQPFSLPDR